MEQLTALITATVNSLGYELVAFERSRAGLLRVFIDFLNPSIDTAAAVSKISLTDCEKVSTQIHYVLGVENIDYQRLEVSSPGLDRPLKKLADFVRFSDREAVITLKKPVDGRKQYRGILRSPCAETIRLEIRPGVTEQQEPAVLNFTLADLDQARLVAQVDFRRDNES